MVIAFTCKCGRKLKAKILHAGRRVKCPDCGEILRIPLPPDSGSAKPKQQITDAFHAQLRQVPPQPKTAAIKTKEEPIAAVLVKEERPPAVAPQAIEPPARSRTAQPTTSGMAIASVITGILGVYCFPAGIVAIVLGILALKEIDYLANGKSGRGLAIAGITLGALGLVLLLITLILPSELKQDDSLLGERQKADMVPAMDAAQDQKADMVPAMDAERLPQPMGAKRKIVPAVKKPAWNAEGLRQAIAKSVGSEGLSVKVNDGFDGTASKIVLVYWDINDNLTNGMIRFGAKHDVELIWQAVAKSSISCREVTVYGSFPMVDLYGNSSKDIVLIVTCKGSTIQKINWANFLTDNVYNVADEVWLHPTFQAP